jgi:hypothetical protein
MKTMKTSKIILIGFFSLVGLFLLSLLIQVDSDKQERGFHQEAISLPPFKHLVLLNSASIDVYQGENDSAFVHFDSKTEAVFPDYELKGDTLVLVWANKDFNWSRTISCSNLKSVRVENSRLNINKLAIDSFKVAAFGSEIHINNKVEIEHICLQANQKSNVKINEAIVKSIDAKVKCSRAELHIKQLDELRAELQDSSILSTWKVLHTDVISEPMSRYYSR